MDGLPMCSSLVHFSLHQPFWSISLLPAARVACNDQSFTLWPRPCYASRLPAAWSSHARRLSCVQSRRSR